MMVVRQILRPLVVGVFIALIASAASAQLVISEFRLRGPNGANDEFVEIHNNTNVNHTVAASGTGTGYGLAASDGVVRCSIPNGTVIPARGHYLCVNSVGYSLASYPAGNGTTATGDATYTTDIPDNAGIALFTSNVAVELLLANRMDAVGSTSEANTLYKEGTGYPALTPFSIDYAFVRDTCGKDGSITTFGPCPNGGLVSDTNNNAADFYFVDTNGTSAGAGQRLGAAGPENLSSPIFNAAAIAQAALDPCVAVTAQPNLRYDGESVPGDNATFGTLDFRRTLTNNTGAPITRLRFRIIDQTTFPAPSGIADLRSSTSTSTVVTVDRAPCGSGTSNVTVEGTTLEQPPSQPNGGAFNSSMSAGTITLPDPLANGASIDLRMIFGLQQHGQYKVGVMVEALPEGGSLFEIEGCTDGCTGELEVVHVARLDPSPVLPGSSVDYRVTFNRPNVSGVDASDFTLTTTGTLAGLSITGVVVEPASSAINYVVTVNTGTGSGTVRLDVIDDDTIVSGGNPLGGAGAGNGAFAAGEEYLVVGDPPEVSSIVRASPDPTAGPTTVDFTVTFSEPVTGVDASDFALTTTGTVAGVSIASVSGAGAVYTVTVNVGAGSGTIRLDVVDDDTIIDADTESLGGVGPGNGNFTTGQVYTVLDRATFAAIPTLDPRMLGLLTLMLAMAAFVALRR